MEAILDHWIDWETPDKQTYPMLVITASEKEAQAYEAFRRLGELCKGLPGKAYQKQLLGLQKDGLRRQTYMTVDIGTLLALVSVINEDAVKRQLMTGWLRSFVVSKQREWNPKKFEITCLCGVSFKNEKKRIAHAKKCQVIKKYMPLLKRVKQSLSASEKPKEKKVAKPTTKITKKSKKKTQTLLDVVNKQKSKKKEKK